MAEHYIYIAVSDGLMTLTKELFDRFAIKVGESWDISDREGGLNGAVVSNATLTRPCCNFVDWKIVAWRRMNSVEEAKDLEARFKSAFDSLSDVVRNNPKWDRPLFGSGETDIVLLPQDVFQIGLKSLNEDVRNLLLAGRSKMFSVMKSGVEAEPQHPSDEEEEFEGIRSLHEQDEEELAEENMDRAEALRETGSYYD